MEMPPPRKRLKSQPSLLGFIGASDTQLKEVDDQCSQIHNDQSNIQSAADAAQHFQHALAWLRLQPECRQHWVSVVTELHTLALSRAKTDEEK